MRDVSSRSGFGGRVVGCLVMALCAFGVASTTAAQGAATALVVTVQDALGRPVSDVAVVVTSEGGASEGLTDGAGTATFTALTTGPATVTAAKSGFRPASVATTVAAGRARVVITLEVGLREGVTVVGQAGYGVSVAETATRMAVPLLDVPQSIQVVSRALFESQMALRPMDAVRNVSGVVAEAGNSGTLDGFVVRGFTVFTTLKNGWRRQRTRGLTELANVDRIEVLKGPSSVLFGEADPGGAVNVITKAPLDRRYAEASLAGGNQGFVRASGDLSGPVGSSRVLGRLNAAVEHREGFRDDTEGGRQFVAPSLRLQLASRTALTVNADFLRQTLPFVGSGAIVSRGAIVAFPIAANLSGGRDARTVEDLTVETQLEHQLNGQWRARASLQVLDTSSDGLQTYFRSVPADARTIPRATYRSIDDAGQTFGRAEVTGSASTGAVHHQLLVGGEWAGNRYDSSYYFSNTVAVDALNPVRLPAAPEPAFNFVYGERSAFAAGFAQDLLTLGERWSALVGVRADRSSTKSRLAFDPDLDAAVYDPAEKTSALSPRAGLVFKPLARVSLFAGYSRSFLPVSGVRQSGERFDPQRGRQAEAGVKVDRADGRLTASAAVFRLRRTNMLIADPDNPGFSIQVGEQQSRGLEFDVVAMPATGLQFTAAYAFTDAEVLNDSRVPDGTGLPNVPKHGFSVWGSYRVSQGPLTGLGLSLGTYTVGQRRGQLATTAFLVPSYTTVDAAATYALGRLQLGINVMNLADRRYFEAAQGTTSLFYGAPRRVVARRGTTF